MNQELTSSKQGSPKASGASLNHDGWTRDWQMSSSIDQVAIEHRFKRKGHKAYILLNGENVKLGEHTRIYLLKIIYIPTTFSQDSQNCLSFIYQASVCFVLSVSYAKLMVILLEQFP
jgi:hypothetical protein